MYNSRTLCFFSFLPNGTWNSQSVSTSLVNQVTGGWVPGSENAKWLDSSTPLPFQQKQGQPPFSCFIPSALCLNIKDSALFVTVSKTKHTHTVTQTMQQNPRQKVWWSQQVSQCSSGNSSPISPEDINVGEEKPVDARQIYIRSPSLPDFFFSSGLKFRDADPNLEAACWVLNSC